MEKIRFEEIKEVYIDEILRIYTYYVLNTVSTFHICPPTRAEMKNLVFFANPKYKTFVIFANDIICGYVLITQHKKREAYDTTGEVTIYLDPDFKGKGIGSLALKYIEDYAVSQEFHGLVASICGQNTASIKLFEKNGYHKCAHYREIGKKFGQWLDIVAYQKIVK